ncbi:MAG: alanine racemase [Candidatus Eremiobacteraeota bacterium]|nr:alanine racemase [Candidatus Eremiobacteraeota bacterium]
MHPLLGVDAPALAANALAWRRHAGVPIRAVVKGDGYGWGYAVLCDALDEVVDAYCVGDLEELLALRRHSRKPAIVLSGVSADRVAEVLSNNGIPTVSTQDEIASAVRWARDRGQRPHFRIGLLPSAGWSGLSAVQLEAIAPAIRSSDADVELWTHVTDLMAVQEHLRSFDGLVSRARTLGIRVAGTDVSSTAPLAHVGARGTSVRIGVGLFGSGKSALPEVTCALRISAPVLRVERHSAGSRVGYGAATLERDEELAVARCGYADGLPQSLAGVDDILSVGMQYLTARMSRCDARHVSVVLLDGASDLDVFAARAGRTPHEVVTAFGNASRARANEER